MHRDLDARLSANDAAFRLQYPGERAERQPIHTVYVPADRYTADLPGRWGEQARATLAEHGPPDRLAAALDLPDDLVDAVYSRVLTKLRREPIEDLRIDFEDGYGQPPDEQEDRVVRAAAGQLRHAVTAGVAPPFVGIRFKSLEAPTRRRGIDTLDLFIGELTATGGLPAGFVVTLPKVTSVEQVQAMVTVCQRIEARYRLAAGELRFEIQVETPQAIIGSDGTALIAPMLHAAAGRCTGLHYGTYDYSASCGIAAQYQSMEHPAADFAKAVMQVAAAGTGVRLSDGSTNVLPVGDAESVQSAWRLHARLIRRSLERGYYQGWDMHPAQLPTRYIATYAFYLQGLPSAVHRLRAYLHRQESGFLDEPATAVALARFLFRAIECGAVDEREVLHELDIDAGQLSELARRP
ncbi:MAG: HpcH/HpaI aldolase/citrate lyase family protein [Actinomycetota bacterium]|nr:HpcH/HpaI aldolase/citrate lyase family protein [Actinomycetota bacterium]